MGTQQKVVSYVKKHELSVELSGFFNGVTVKKLLQYYTVMWFTAGGWFTDI
jgi:hypothetical protein